MEKNQTGQVLLFCLLLLLLLTALSALPTGINLFDFELRAMDIYADVRDTLPHRETQSPTSSPETEEQVIVPVDTLAGDTTATVEPAPPPILPPKDSALYGRIVEDYTPDQKGLERFFAAVDSISQGRTVRVAWYGDSFVEGDILVGDLRDTLQTLWGGTGVGFVPITSEVAQFKRTLKHQFKGWTAFSIIKKTDARPRLGLNGYAYKPSPDAKVHYEGAKYFKHTQRWHQVRLFYTASLSSEFVYQAKEEAPHSEPLPARPGLLSHWKWSASGWGTDAFSMRFPETDGLMLYGATLESGPGIYLDNFSVRGNSGGPLKLLDPGFIQQFDAVQQYDLVVLQVGLNAVTNSLNNIRWYEAELDRTLAHLKKCFPAKPILVVSVGDRGGKVGNEIETMRGVPAIVQMQRDLARKHGLLFYDLFWGMGGPGTMFRFANHRPRLANTDYTHLTHEGGRVVGYQFARLFIEEQAKWRAKRKPQQ
jgi:hypothetical protein